VKGQNTPAGFASGSTLGKADQGAGSESRKIAFGNKPFDFWLRKTGLYLIRRTFFTVRSVSALGSLMEGFDHAA
jgi:hypothetical protein